MLGARFESLWGYSLCAFPIREKSKKINFVVHMQGWGLKVRSIPCLCNGERWSCGNRPLPDQESQLENEQLRAAPLQNQIAPKSFDSRTLNGTMNSERGEKTPTPKISALLRKRPVLLRANFVLTEDRKRPYYGHFRGKIHREGSCSKAAGGP